jgi:hypothetical protein
VRGLAQTATLWEPIGLCYSWVHRAARILKNEEGLRVEELRRDYRRLLAEMGDRREEAAELQGAVSLFLKVTKSYWKGLFHCYRFPEGTLPRTIQRSGTPLRIGTLRRTACQWQKKRLARDGGKGQRARVGLRGHATGGSQRSGHTPRRPRRMAGTSGYARKETGEPPRPAALQAGPGCLPGQA